MSVFEIILIVGMVAGIAATVAQMMGKSKIAAILAAVAGGIDKAKPLLVDLKVTTEVGKGITDGKPITMETDAKKIVTDLIKGEVKGAGLLKDLDAFLNKNGLNK